MGQHQIQIQQLNAGSLLDDAQKLGSYIAFRLNQEPKMSEQNVRRRFV